jgi:hypothetical protein
MIDREAPYSLARIFMRRPIQRNPRGGGRGSRHRLDRGTRRSPELEQLESRQLLAIEVFQYPVAGVTAGSSSYAVLLVSDGTSGFLKKNATPSPTFTYADNSQFLDNPATLQPESITFAELPVNFGPLTSFYVTSGERKVYTGPGLTAAAPGTTTTILNTGIGSFDVGLSDGVVPGTFRARVSIVDGGGDPATAWLVASKPGEIWNLAIERIPGLGDGELPAEGRIDSLDGDVTLRGWNEAPLSVTLTPWDWGVYTDASVDPDPLSFTLFAGQTVSQRMLVDLSRNESTITINSPLTASLGSSGDPLFFSGAGGVSGQIGQVVLDGSTIVTNADVSSSSLFTAGVSPWSHFLSTRIPVRNVTINRPLAAPRQQLLVEGSAGSPGRLLVGEQGSLAASLTSPLTKDAVSLDIQSKHADVVFAGVVNAKQQTYLLQSPGDPRAYSLTTVSPTSGVQTGRILGDTVGITLANDAGGEFNVRTTIDNLRMTAATAPSTPVLPYAIRVLETDDLVVDAVPASQREIEITAAGALTLQSSIETSGSLTLTSQKALALSSPISSATGNVALLADSVSSNSPVTAGGTRGVTLTSRSATGDLDVNALVRAGGPVKQPVRVATTANVDLATGGLRTIDGVPLFAGDRVLVKNQTVASQNGIYVANAGAWTRAADANASGQFAPGFSVFVTEGSQIGGWTFANPANPSLGTTGLIFAPASATQTYGGVRAATTTNVDLATGGLLTIDGVPLAAGDRVLVKNQTNKRQNGIYVASAGSWQRASDADTASELRAGSYVFVAAGTANGSKGFVLDDDAVQVGVTELNFSAFAVQPTRTNVYSPANVLPSAVAATTVNLDLSVAQPTIDGQSLSVGDLVLVKNQVNAAENGIYKVQDDNKLARSLAADEFAELARGSTVYVSGGAVNASTSWTFNDSTSLLGSITGGNQVVNGLTSTTRLAIGMLVTGPGIPAGTTITGITGPSSIRLSKLATVSDPVAVLTFTSVSAIVVDTTPIVFVPTGGAVVITAGGSVTSTAATPSSRLQGSSALVSAGRPASGTAAATSTITANTNVGLLSAAAPAAITIDNANELSLVGVGTLTGGPITVTASGTLTASSVTATGDATSPGNITLLSTFGNVVAAEVASTLGDIDLTASRGDVRITAVKSYAGGVPFAANVLAQAGSVSVTANESPGSTLGNIRVDGRLVADGAASDILLKTSTGSLLFASTAFVNAKDQLLIDTPNAVVNADAGAQVAASRLSLTAQFGAGETSPPPALASYQAAFINRTDDGDIVYSNSGSLTVEGAITTDGSIEFTAPDITVTGVILPNGTEKKISLLANAGDLRVDAPLTASGDISVKAPTGKISRSDGTATPLITTPLSLFVEAATKASLTTQVATLDASLSESNAILEITETDSLVIERVLLSNGGTADLKIGSSATGGSATVKAVDVGAASGTLKLLANDNIVDAGTPTVADIVANRVELTSTTGKIDVDTDVNVLLASATQKNQTITIDDLGASGLELQAVATNNADISVKAKGTILATSVTTSGRISLATTDAEADIVVNKLSATGNTISLAARRSILEATPSDATADMTATTVTLSATDGSIDAHVDASAASATAKGPGATIRIRDDGDLSIGDGASGIEGDAVTFTIGGTLTQTRPIMATSLTVEPTVVDGNVGAKLDDAGNKVQSLTILGGSKSVSFTNAVDLSVAALTGGSVSLRAAGTISQPDPTVSIKAVTLFAEATAPGDVLLVNPANAVGTLTGKTASGTLMFVNGSGFKVGSAGIVAGTNAAGDGDIFLTADAGDLEVAGPLTAANDRISLFTPAGTITQAAGTITSGVFEWTAKTAPTFTSLAVGAVGANLTGPGDITIGTAGQPLTVASASTADGNVKIVGSDVTIDGLVTVGGVAKSATVTASGSLLFQNQGRIVNADASGSVALTAGTTLTAANQDASTTVAAGGSLAISSGDAASLKTDVNTLSATVTAGGLKITDAAELAISGITAAGQSVSLIAAGGITQTGPIVAASLSASNSSGSIVLTHAANDVGTFAASSPHSGGDVLFLNKRGFSVGGVGITAGTPTRDDGGVTLTAASGNLTVTSNISAIEDVVQLLAPGGVVKIDPGVTIEARELVIDDSTVVSITEVIDNVSRVTGNVPDGALINDATPTITGITLPGNKVTVSLNGSPIAPVVVADASGNWSLTTASLADGGYAITAAATNLAGDTGSPSAAYGITIDATAPATPTITTVTDNVLPVIGDVANGGSTNDTVLVLSGTTESDTTVEIFNGPTKLGDATVSGATWSFITAVLVNGTTYVFKAVASDQAGNVGSDSATHTVTIDTTAPLAPTLALGTGVASGATQGEGTQLSGVVTVSGETGAAIVVTFTRGVATVTKNLAGTGTSQPVTLTVGDLATLGNGTVNVSATQSDAAGNPQTVAAASISFTLDTVAPAAPTLTLRSGVTEPVSNSEAFGGAVTVTGETGAVIVVTFTRGASTVTKTLTGTGAGQDVALSATDLTTLGDGTVSVSATQSDGAGNPQSGPPATLSFALDATPPAPPQLLILSGVASGATAAEATQASGVVSVVGINGAPILVTFTRGPNTVTRSFIGNGVGQPVTLSGADLTTLGDGVVNVSATQADAAGNTSAAATTSFTLDTIAPASPFITGLVDDVAAFVGNVAAGGRTNDNTLRIVGTAEPGATVAVRNGPTLIGSATADAGGNWAFTTAPLADGGYAFSAFATDVAGNANPSSRPAYAVTLDTAPPAAATITSVTDNVGSIIGNVAPGGRTDDTTLRIAGTAEPGSQVTVRSGNAVLRRVFANEFGTWAIVTDPLAVRLHNLNALARDAAGNNGPASATHTVTIDQTSPTILFLGSTTVAGTYGEAAEIAIFARTSERMRAGSAIDVTLNTGVVVRLSTPTERSELNGIYRVGGGALASPLSIISVANVSPIASDIAGNPVAGLPPVPVVLTGINVDSPISASAIGFATDPAFAPTQTSAVTSIPIVFSTEVTGVSLADFQLFYNERESVSLRGSTITGSGRNYTLTLPANLTNRIGSYRLAIGPSSAIRAVFGGAQLTAALNLYWTRV